MSSEINVNGEREKGKALVEGSLAIYSFCFFSCFFLLNCMIARQLPTIDALLIVNVPDVTQNRCERGKNMGKRDSIGSHLLFLFYLLFLHDSETITHNRCTFNGKGARCHAKSTRTGEKIKEKGKALVEGS